MVVTDMERYGGCEEWLTFGEGFRIGGEGKRGRNPYILDCKIKWISVLFAKTCNSGLQLYCTGVEGG